MVKSMDENQIDPGSILGGGFTFFSPYIYNTQFNLMNILNNFEH